MIIYATKETFERYRLKMPDEMETPFVRAAAELVLEHETGDALLEWGAKLFYFDRRKCIQVVNFASRLTFFIVDVKLADIDTMPEYIVGYLFDLYDGDAEMTELLKLFFKKYPMCAFSRLKDRSIIASLNYMQSTYLADGLRLREYIREGILHTKELNKKVNTQWLFRMPINGKPEYFCSSERFSELLKDRMSNKPRK